VEFFLQIPLEWQVRQGWTKYLVRKAFATELSPELLWRKGKEHLGWHFAHEVMLAGRSNMEPCDDTSWDQVNTYLPTAAAEKMTTAWLHDHAPVHADDIFAYQSLARYLDRVRNLA